MPQQRRVPPQQTKHDRRRIKELERELRRKDKALADSTVNGTNAGDKNQGESSTGDGSGQEPGEGEVEGPGTPGEGATLKRIDGAVGRTLQSVAAAHKAGMLASPLISSATGFFTVQASGSCPSWTLPETAFTPSIVMDFWCVSSLSAVWTMVGACMLIVISWVAFRIGML